MKSSITEEFREAFARLPKNIQQQARKSYRKFLESPDSPGLHFKKAHTRREIYSIRITQHYRALGTLQDDEIIWFWIGSHTEYNRLLKKL
jgi:mRNA-degrading endonuclease RelE of RelBE toxin-antitoxin system